MGLMEAARLAGIYPKISPIPTETPKDIRIEPKVG